MTARKAERPKTAPRIVIPDDAPIIPSHRVQDHKVGDTPVSTYGDSCWDLEIGVPQVNLEKARRYIDFGNLPYSAEYVEGLLKPFAWCCMNLDHSIFSGNYSDLSPGYLKGTVTLLRRYLRFLDERGVSVGGATSDDNDAWVALFKSYTDKVRAVGVVVRLNWYRSYLALPIPAGDPWAHADLRDLLGKRPKSGENSTPRVPRPIMDAMLRWALFYIEHASKDILVLLVASNGRTKFDRERLFIASHKFECLPGSEVPWHASPASFFLMKEVQNLVIAAYIIVAYLSGMRDGEVQSIRYGSWGVERSRDGRIVRYYVRATVTKTKKKPKLRKFIVLPEVHAALECMSKLAETFGRVKPSCMRARNADLVFRRYRHVKVNDVALQTRPALWLRYFQTHVNQILTRLKNAGAKLTSEIFGSYHIPAGEDGRPWKWKTKHFRRTIAWYIANEPFGIVAGMRQFGHVRDTVFQGYAGSPDAGFRDEIERAAVVGRELTLVEMYLSVMSGGKLGGRMGAILEGEFKSMDTKRIDLGARVVNDGRVMAMLRNHSKIVYPGVINDCYFDPERALCLTKKQKAEKAIEPILARCDWEKCANSCTSGKHVQMLQSSLSRAETYKKTRRLPKNQRKAIDLLMGKYRRALSKVGR